MDGVNDNSDANSSATVGGGSGAGWAHGPRYRVCHHGLVPLGAGRSRSGQKWRRGHRRRLGSRHRTAGLSKAAAVVVQLLSPTYIAELVDGIGIPNNGVLTIPVELDRCSHRGSLTEVAVLNDRPFNTLRGNARADLADQLIERARRWIRQPPETRVEEAFQRVRLPDLDHRYVNARGVAAARERLLVNEMQPANAVDVQEALSAWALDPAGPPYFALLGDYGLGKTTACQILTRTPHRAPGPRPNGPPSHLP